MTWERWTPPSRRRRTRPSLPADRKEREENTLTFYSRDRPTVSLGYFGNAEESIDLDLCREKDIGIVRRPSGGSAVFTDPGQIIYSVTLEAGMVPTNPKDSYPLICGGVVTALRSLGMAAEHKPLNDVVVHGRKISGSAQTRKAGFVLQHGTVIVDSDLDLMMRVDPSTPGKAPGPGRHDLCLARTGQKGWLRRG